MTAQSQQDGSAPAKPRIPAGKKEVKILMLHGKCHFMIFGKRPMTPWIPLPRLSSDRYLPCHAQVAGGPIHLTFFIHALIINPLRERTTKSSLSGYTQSGNIFRAKTRALEKMLAKTLAPISLHPTLIYPTAPNRLRPQDIPGYQPPEGGDAGTEKGDDDYDAWAWWRKDEGSGEYRFFSEGMETIADAIREAGGVDGVVGFSQGGAATGIVTAALESGRTPPEGIKGDWARSLREANNGQPLKFAVPYSGFFAPIDTLQWLYEPQITTPTLHVLGSLDTVVDESRSQGLVDRCADPLVVTHPGGHYVPVSKEWVMPLAGFIRQHAAEKPRAGL